MGMATVGLALAQIPAFRPIGAMPPHVANGWPMTL